MVLGRGGGAAGGAWLTFSAGDMLRDLARNPAPNLGSEECLSDRGSGLTSGARVGRRGGEVVVTAMAGGGLNAAAAEEEEGSPLCCCSEGDGPRRLAPAMDIVIGGPPLALVAPPFRVLASDAGRLLLAAVVAVTPDET